MSASKTSKDIRCQPERSCKGGSSYNEDDYENTEMVNHMATLNLGQTTGHDPWHRGPAEGQLALSAIKKPGTESIKDWMRYFDQSIDLIMERINVNNTSELKKEIENDVLAKMEKSMKDLVKKEMTEKNTDHENAMKVKIL